MRIAALLLILALPLGLLLLHPATVNQLATDEPLIVLRPPDGGAQLGVPDTVAWQREDDDDFRPFIPPQPIQLRVGKTPALDFAALGDPVAVSYRLYRLDNRAILDRAETWLAVDPTACVVEFAELPPASRVSLPLRVRPGSYALEIYAHFSDWRYVRQGFHVAVGGAAAGSVPDGCLNAAAAPTVSTATPAGSPTPPPGGRWGGRARRSSRGDGRLRVKQPIRDGTRRRSAHGDVEALRT